MSWSFIIIVLLLPFTSKKVYSQERDDSYNYQELVSVPDVNGRFYKINITQRELEYARSYKSAYRINFYVHTRQSPEEGKLILIGDKNSLKNSNFNPKHPTKIVAHGWMGNINSIVNQALLAAYLKKGEYNIIIIDWSDAAETVDYFSARKRIGKAGRKVAKLIDFLSTHGETPPSSIYLIGHSLGAHMCGVAARRIRSGRIGVLISLDAALPLFLPYHKDRITSSVADYVLSIHTNGGRLGIHEPIGHAAFYPNWGKTQPGCGFDPFASCSHRRCVELLAESIVDINNIFVARKCVSFKDILKERCQGKGEYAILGGDPLNTTYKGIFYLKTNSEQPYGLGKIR